MPDKVTRWLDQLGLGQYAEAFRENAIEWDQLPNLSDDELTALGVKALGHRKRIRESPGVRTEAERRQLTVMFCDLAGSTELSRQLDPEDLREVNRAYQDACKAAIERFEGYIARYMGDGVLAYFGYPQAHEDDAERAIHAGLGVVESVAGLGTDTQAVELAVRVGIATGPVVVGDLIGEGASQESAVVGETPNLAARLQGLAAKNTVVIGLGTHELTCGRFEYDDLGTHSLKGISDSVPAWRVIAPAAVESRFEARRQAGLTPLVGRKDEIGLLLDRWARAKEGYGQIVLISGEAGIGKSRVTEILREGTAGDAPALLRYQCSPFYTNTAFYPVIEQLQQAARIEPDEPNEAKLDKLESLLTRDRTDSEAVRLFAGLLSISAEDRYAPLAMTPERQKEQTLEALVNQMESLSRYQPVLLIFEDVHWADPTSLELLELAIHRAQRIPALMVLTYRPEFSPTWRKHTHVTLLMLSRLTRSLASAMVEEVTGGKPLPNDVLEQIIERTDGVPLFVEELTKTILESGMLTEVSDRYVVTGPLGDSSIPNTLHDSLMARLDRLGMVKEVAQAASVIGREFGVELLTAISPLNESALQSALDELMGCGLLTGRVAGQKYTFKHALVQNAAYESLLKSRRQELHKRIAHALEDSFAEIVETQPELLAHHCNQGGMLEPAIGYWMKAGHRAEQRSADLEAAGHLTAALEAVMKMPQSTERDDLELGVQLALFSSLTRTKGFASDEANTAAARARELCEELGETEKLHFVLFSEGLAHMAVGQYQAAKDVGDELLQLGERHDNVPCMLDGLGVLGWNALGLGEFSVAQAHAERELELYDLHIRAVPNRVPASIDERVSALGIRSFAMWFKGISDQSVAFSDESIAYARQLNHEFTLAWALSWMGAQLAALRRDSVLARKLATEVIEFSEEKRSPVDLAWAQVFAGWAIGIQGSLGEGISTLCKGLSFLNSHFSACRTIHLALLAELYIHDGRFTEACATLEDARLRITGVDERIWEPEILRLEADACIREDSQAYERAESLLMEALEVSGHLQAKSLELRSSVALGKLWQQQGKRRAALDLVAPVYTWFTEGFDTPDLKEAKALLEQLS